MGGTLGVVDQCDVKTISYDEQFGYLLVLPSLMMTGVYSLVL